MEWHLLPASRQAGVNLAMALCGGQCFRWYPTPRASYVGVVQDRVYELREKASVTAAVVGTQGRHCVEYRRLYPTDVSSSSSSSYRKAVTATPSRVGQKRHGVCETLVDEHFLTHYLALDVDVDALWHEWTVGNAMRDHPLVRHLAGLQETNDVARRVDTPVVKSEDGGGKSKVVTLTTATQCPCNPVRHLRQDLHETLLSFVCSQNNHVKRITSMVQALCATYGSPLCRVHLQRGEVQPLPPSTSARAGHRRAKTAAVAVTEHANNDAGWIDLYSFPTIDQLRRVSEDELRGLGFGYRSRYIVQCVQAIVAARTEATHVTPNANVSGALTQHRLCWGEPFYERLLQPQCGCAERRAALIGLPGVGRKVADCVLLFALGHTELVPVDTHMAQVASAYLTDASPTHSTTKRSRGTGNAFPRKRTRKETPAKSGTIVDGGWQETLRAWRARGEARHVAQRGKAGNGKTTGKDSDGGTMAPLNDKLHDAIQAGFRELFGPHCGLAHTVLFYERMRR